METLQPVTVVDIDGRETALDPIALRTKLIDQFRPELVEATLQRLTNVLGRVRVRKLGTTTIRNLISEIIDNASEERLERIVKADALTAVEPLEFAEGEGLPAYTFEIASTPKRTRSATQLRRALGEVARQTFARRGGDTLPEIAIQLAKLEGLITGVARRNSDDPATASAVAAQRIVDARRSLYHPLDLERDARPQLKHAAENAAREKLLEALVAGDNGIATGQQPVTTLRYELRAFVSRVKCIRETRPTLGSDEFHIGGEYNYSGDSGLLIPYDHDFDTGDPPDTTAVLISDVDLIPGAKTIWTGSHLATEEDLCDARTADLIATILAKLADLAARAGIGAAKAAANAEVQRAGDAAHMPQDQIDAAKDAVNEAIDEASEEVREEVISALHKFLEKALGPERFTPSPFSSKVEIDWTQQNNPPVWTPFLDSRQLSGAVTGPGQVVSHFLNLHEAVEKKADEAEAGFYNVQLRFEVRLTA